MPQKVAFLAEPHRFKALYGGRDAIKSWSMARQLLITGAQRDYRALCTRETMNTIKESVHLLLKDQISMLGLNAYYDVQANAIYGKQEGNKDTMFVYAGLRSMATDKTALKAYESFDVAWVEEAQTISTSSLRTLIPTMRKKGSEIWFSFNPDLQDDPIIDFLFRNPPPGLVKVQTSYLDNIWLSEESQQYIEHLKRTNRKQYEEDYLGKLKTQVEGAVFGDQLAAMTAGGRERSVPHDPTRPVETYWDIGDHWLAIWFVQVYPLEYHLVEYQEFEFPNLPDVFKEIKDKPYLYGVPLDGAHGAEADATATLGIMRALIAHYPKLKEYSLEEMQALQRQWYAVWRDGVNEYWARQGKTERINEDWV